MDVSVAELSAVQLRMMQMFYIIQMLHKWRTVLEKSKKEVVKYLVDNTNY